jgi:hypothetical protein
MSVWLLVFLGLAGWIVVVTSVAGALGAQITCGAPSFLEKSYHDAAARLGRSVARRHASPQTMGQRGGSFSG